MLRLALCGLFMAAGFSLAACGGEETAQITEVATVEETNNGLLEKADFVAQGDTRCREANGAIANISSGAGSSAELALASSQEASITEGMLSSLRDLGDTKTDQDLLDAYLSAVQDVVDVLSNRKIAAERDDLTAYEGFATDLADARSSATSAAAAFGFKFCGTTEAPTDTTVTTPGATTTPTTTTPTETPVPVDPEPTGATGTTTPPPVDPGTPTPPDDGGAGGISDGGSGGISP